MMTIKDVAQKAGVSIATVSRVLNGYAHVRPAVRARVQTVIAELDYRPNRLASSFRTQQSRIVGVLLRQQRTPFSSSLAYAIEEFLFDAGYQVLICSTNGDAAREEAYIRSMLELKAQGVIIRPSGSTARTGDNVALLQKAGIPVVFADMWYKVAGVSGVVCDNFSGGYQGIRYLLGLGHRRIGVIAGEGAQRQTRIDIGNVGSERVRGIIKASQDLASDVVLQFCSPFKAESNLETGRLEAERLLAAHPELTALFCTTDMLAVGAMQAAHQLGIRVPDQLSILGYDGVLESAITFPALSTMRQPIHEMGTQAARALHEHIENKDAPVQSVVLENSLIIRESTAAPFS